MLQEIKELNKEIRGEVIQIRRHLHQFPELSYREKNTSAYVCEYLGRWDIPYQKNIGGFGIAALVGKGETGDRVIALRADMDALPIQEENKVPYASVVPGVMHACGHDVHTASLLGTAYILKQLENQIPGRVKLIFQPAEERPPGGAALMIKDGVLQNPAPDAILGQHVHPPLPAGVVGFRPGKFMASSDEFVIRIKGKGGHGALPHKAVDPVLAAAHVIIALQQIVSRRSDPAVPSVLTVGKINSCGGAANIIPESVEIEATFRTMEEGWRSRAHELIKDTALHAARALGAEIEIEMTSGYPFLYNDPEITDRMKNAAMAFLGDSRVVDLPVRMTSEDFANYTREIPGCFYRLGISSARVSHPVLHSSAFDVDELCLRESSGLMAFLTCSDLIDNQTGK